MPQIQVAQTEYRSLTPDQIQAVDALLHNVFPVAAVRQQTSSGKLSTKTVTGPVLDALRQNGLPASLPVGLAGSGFGLEPDFLGKGEDVLGIVGGELQLALRETVIYDFLKHAWLQRSGICTVTLELIPSRRLASSLDNACASFDWALTMLDELVVPTCELRIALVGLELVP